MKKKKKKKKNNNLEETVAAARSGFSPSPFPLSQRRARCEADSAPEWPQLVAVSASLRASVSFERTSETRRRRRTKGDWLFKSLFQRPTEGDAVYTLCFVIRRPSPERHSQRLKCRERDEAAEKGVNGIICDRSSRRSSLLPSSLPRVRCQSSSRAAACIASGAIFCIPPVLSSSAMREP